ncbi:hypothetical protein TIFTF001_042189 [Ficus carica]|uniref:Uncharacterized protein n=1 Tax=Ficus carica TaxID=3494 RepID=A0AA87ZXF8_FICCA|nr:hypothetical protein TIFTF001_042189 [Ficus carica]
MILFGRDKNFIGIEVVARDEADTVLGAHLPGYETPEASVVKDIEAILNNNSENVSYGFRQVNSVVHYLAGYTF